MDLSTAQSALRSVVKRISACEDTTEKAEAVLAALSSADPSSIDVAKLRADVRGLFEAPEWHALAAALLTGKHLIELSVKAVDPVNASAGVDAWEAAAATILNKEFSDALVVAAGKHLENTEPRVRTSVVELLEWLCRKYGVEVYNTLQEAVYASIATNFDRDGFEVDEDEKEVKPESHEADEKKEMEAGADAGAAGAAGAGAGSGDAGSVTSVSSTLSAKPRIAHDTVGWKALDSSIRAIRAMVEGCGHLFLSEGLLNAHLVRDVIPRASEHLNRFVRESTFFLCTAIMAACDPDTDDVKTLEFDEMMCTLLARGLGDNWSQVRYAASVSTRQFLSCTAKYRSKFFDRLVPRMCLNRYYVAEGVRLYSQATWKEVMGSDGPAEVAKVINPVVSYYLTQSDADNHAVREAACHCIAELAHKVDKPAVAPHVPDLLNALIVCFKDESWPVRDAACVATGRFVAAFPEEARPQLDALYDLWFAHAWDNIWSVREDSAVALGDVMETYGDEAFDRVLPKMEEMMAMAKDQPSDSKLFGDLSNETTFGVAKRERDNDPALHTGQQVFSCGSLAPKLRKGGCMDHGFARKKEPWEATDGAVYLLREVARIRPDAALKYLPSLAEAAALTHFTHATNLQETIWKQLPAIANHVGKRNTKRYLEFFIDPMVRGLKSPSRLTAFAAGECVTALQTLVGPRIFMGRLAPDQVAVVESSQYVGKGGAVGAAPMMGMGTGMGMHPGIAGAAAAGGSVHPAIAAAAARGDVPGMAGTGAGAGSTERK